MQNNQPDRSLNQLHKTALVRKQKVYVPPEAKLIDEFAQRVYSCFVEEGHLPTNDPRVAAEFADFLNFVAYLVAKQLNQGQYDVLDGNGD